MFPIRHTHIDGESNRYGEHAPRPFYPAGRRIDSGKTVINEVLAAMRPRLHLFGHHHEFTDSVRQGVRSIGLDVVTRSYLLIDADTFKCERLDT